MKIYMVLHTDPNSNETRTLLMGIQCLMLSTYSSDPFSKDCTSLNFLNMNNESWWTCWFTVIFHAYWHDLTQLRDLSAENGCLEWAMYRRHDRCKGSRLFVLSRVSTGGSTWNIQSFPVLQSTEPGFHSAFLWPRPASCQHQGNVELRMYSTPYLVRWDEFVPD